MESIFYTERPVSVSVMRAVWMTLLLFFCLSATAVAEDQDFTALSIEELMNIKVTSVSKKAQHLSDSAAAIFVITGDDIRHSGATTIADALRLVPGLNVARIDSNKWAVTSRGATSRFSDKLLVLMDGRSIYNPYFSGVYWEIQDVILDDIERIEVIRGPGATLWGANAVNGVINIITKSAADTQGGLVSLGGGSYEKAFANVRFGGEAGENIYYRLYAKGTERDEFNYLDDTGADDDWGMRQGGFRLDSGLSASDQLIFQGDLYQGDINQQLDLPTVLPPFVSTIDDDAEVSGGNLLTRWERTFSSTADLSLQLYYDHNRRKEAWTDQDRDTVDIDLQHHFKANATNDIVWGLRYSRTHDEFGNTSVLTLDPTTRTDELFGAFLQDEITLLPERLWLTLGSKLEHNDYTGYELQPSARLFWAAAAAHKFWASVSRAVRTPSRVESDATLTNDVIPPTHIYTPPILLTIVGNEDLEAERLMAYEIGYRFLPEASFSIDISAFYNDYEDLRTVETGTPIIHGVYPATPPLYLEVPSRFTNDYSTRTFGAEVALAWQVVDGWKLDLAYSYLECDVEDSVQLGRAPQHQVSLRSSFQLARNLDLDLWLRYVDDATTINVNTSDFFYDIDAYLTADLRLAWRPVEGLELSIVGQNLLDSNHLEFVQEVYSRPTEVPRSVYGMVTYRF